ncbi:MAG: hypothetical protein JSV46_11965 [Candidatus Aminicenantes bacterium]|nr:MAG: hypothetical protein JSV46_11965 [Candidatus Aminicenantes bacterium]
MKKRGITTIFALASVILLAVSSAEAKWFLDFETGLVSSGYNDVRIPGDTGTEFSLSDDLQTDSSAFFRFRFGYQFNERHTIFAFVAPLSLNASGSVDQDILFFEETFPANTPLDGVYRFNSYRLTYRYDFIRKEKLTLGVGFTAKIRDAAIRVEGGGLSSEKTNVGFVPLLNFRLNWRFADKFGLLFEGDALASPGGQGRAEDVLLALQMRLNENISFRAGYRIIEGGADVEEVYNFALLHFFSVGTEVRF